MANKKITLDQDKCIGCNTCPIIDPETFELDPETYKARIKKQPQVIGETQENAVLGCPVGAISIVEE